MAKARANTLRPELVKKGMIDKETNTETGIPSTKRRHIKTCKDSLRHKINASKKYDANCDLPMINLRTHWVEQIRQCGSLQLYFADTHEQVHKMNFKDGWNTCNLNLNYRPQVTSATTLVSVRNTRVFQTALMALTEPRTL
jgi:hypothetical protein